MKLRIDIVEERVTLGEMELFGQWVDFYALLALALVERPGEERYVSAETVARVGPWRHKKSASVGKEIARHRALLEASGLDRLLGCKGKTRAWCLRIPPNEIRLVPDADAVRVWLQGRSLRDLPPGEWIEQLRALIEAALSLQRGDAEMALGRMTGFPETKTSAEPALEAWSALLEGRALYQYHDEDDEALHALQEDWIGRTDAVGRAVSARLRCFLALRYRFEDPSSTLASLNKLAADLELRGDIGSLGVVVNVMGILARRAGNPDVGMHHHLRGAALFGIAGDYPSLQGALFNLALCRKEALSRQGRPPDAAVLDLVELCRLVCANIGVGGDSAQAEILGAQCASELGDISLSRRYLRDAEALLQRIDSTYDQACFLEVRALVERTAPSGASDPARDLRTAAALFDKAGEASSAMRIRRALEADPVAGRSPRR